MIEWETLHTLNPWMEYVPIEQSDAFREEHGEAVAKTTPKQSDNDMKANYQLFLATVQQAEAMRSKHA